MWKLQAISRLSDRSKRLSFQALSSPPHRTSQCQHCQCLEECGTCGPFSFSLRHHQCHQHPQQSRHHPPPLDHPHTRSRSMVCIFRSTCHHRMQCSCLILIHHVRSWLSPRQHTVRTNPCPIRSLHMEKLIRSQIPRSGLSWVLLRDGDRRNRQSSRKVWRLSQESHKAFFVFVTQLMSC